MDDIVKQAMAKWPNVPYCYGWLALDARGTWRMRDEAAQRAGSPGDRLTNAALVGFIARNYLSDDRGCWYFQNGPQRVYINLETTPFIARTDPAQGLVLHTGQPLGAPDEALLTDAGGIVLRAAQAVAQVDDRDAAQLLQAFELDGRHARIEDVMAWLEGATGELALRWQERSIVIGRMAADDVPGRFGFVRRPDLMQAPK